MVVNLFFYNKVLLRLRGSLDFARDDVHFITTTKFALADFISSSYGRFHPRSGFHPSRTDFIAKPLLRLRGFLHAFHLVEMTIPPKKTSSRAQSRDPLRRSSTTPVKHPPLLSFRAEGEACHSEGIQCPKNLLERSFILVVISTK